jgi:hypothetical protein
MMKSKGMTWAGHVARKKEKRNAYILLVEKPEGKKPLRRLKRANFTDRATVGCRRSKWQRLRIEGCRVTSEADPLRPYSCFSRPESLLFLPSSSSVALTRLSGPCSRFTASQGFEPGPLAVLLPSSSVLRSAIC